MSHQSNRPNQWVRIVTMEHTWPNKALDISFLSDGSLIPSNNLGWGWQKASSYNYIIKYTFCNHLMQFQAADLHKKDTGIDSFNEDDKSYTTFCPSTSCFNNNHTVLLIKLWLCIRILGFLILTTFLQNKNICFHIFCFILCITNNDEELVEQLYLLLYIIRHGSIKVCSFPSSYIIILNLFLLQTPHKQMKVTNLQC